MSLKIRLLCACLCAALAVIISVNYAQSMRAEAQKLKQDVRARFGGDVVSLVVSTRQLDAGHTIQSDDICVRDWASDLAPEGACTNPDEVIGKVVQASLPQNAPLSSLTFDKGDHDAKIPEGYVALGISSSDKQNLGAFCVSGSRLIAFDAKSKGSTCISKDIIVLSNNSGDSIYASEHALLLAVRPSDVEALLQAQSNQSLRFVLAAGESNAETDRADAQDASKEAKTGANPSAQTGSREAGSRRAPLAHIVRTKHIPSESDSRVRDGVSSASDSGSGSDSGSDGSSHSGADSRSNSNSRPSSE